MKKRLLIALFIMIISVSFCSCQNTEKDSGMLQDDIINYVKIYLGGADVSLSYEKNAQIIDKFQKMFADLKFNETKKDSLFGMLSISFYIQDKDNPHYYIDIDGTVYILNKATTYQSKSKVDYQFILDYYNEKI